MEVKRRELLAGGLGLALAPQVARAMSGTAGMHGLIGRMRARPGQRDALTAIMLEGTQGMPGCLSYVVAKDPVDAEIIWITEVWDSKASHTASLQIPAVRAAIQRARPLIAAYESGQETIPVGGVGLRR
ncbi:MAG TPA: putative quinol monooxygenase [Allosphingosinicella sp.]|nr:putative quinol monooxygenase [Allosphingosinicella sp.]